MNEDWACPERLRRMWDVLDPAPVDLADRVLFALQLEDMEFELLRMHGVLESKGSRGHESATTVTFTSDSLCVMVTLSEPRSGQRRLDGWLTPAAALRMELRAPQGRQQTMADLTGRFAFPETPAGPIQLVVYPTEDTAVNLARSVITPAIQL
jgi:hypothetical protein